MADRQDTHWRHAAAARLAGCLPAGSGTARPAAAPASPNPTATLAAGTPHPVPGGGALIAITGAGTRARGYLCDGTPGRAVRLAEWFTAPARGATVDGVSSRHRLAAGLGRLAAGAITFTDGRSYRFTAPLAALDGSAGLFEGAGRLDGLAYHAGWIVLPGRDQRGAAEYPQGPLEGYAIAYFPVDLV